MEKFEKSTKERAKLYKLMIAHQTIITDCKRRMPLVLYQPNSTYIGSGKSYLEGEKGEQDVELFLCRSSNNRDIAVVLCAKPENIITDGENISIIGGRGCLDIYTPIRDSISVKDREKRKGFLRILSGVGL